MFIFVYEYYYLNSKQPIFFFQLMKFGSLNINGITVYKHIMADGNQRFERVD